MQKGAERKVFKNVNYEKESKSPGGSVTTLLALKIFENQWPSFARNKLP